ncbi:MAG: hypothetical protein A2Y33_10090 [Spirochaetes bacterium GWF1_51_8]|nr:MAG: hypothetical protein A2Y33_10090 [Spirochaetes bacterium GWF1_51_8]
MLRVRIAEKSDIVIFYLRGEIVIINLHEVKAPLEEKIGKNFKKFIFNMEQVTYMDSAAIGMFYTKLVMLKKEGGTVELIKPNATIRRIIESTRLVELVSIYENEEEAVKALK